MINTVITAGEVGPDNKAIILSLFSEVTAGKMNFNGEAGADEGLVRIQNTMAAKTSVFKSFNRFFYSVASAFPDFELKITNLIVKGDKVMVRYAVSGIQRSAFMGMEPTNEKMSINGIDIFRLENGVVVQHWDAARQIEAVHEPADHRSMVQGPMAKVPAAINLAAK